MLRNNYCASLHLPVQVKCTVIRAMDPVWPQFTRQVQRLLVAQTPGPTFHHVEIFLVEAFALWRSLISVRANLR